MTILLLYLLLGLIVAIIGALPLGAVNLAVINTSVKENIKSIAYIVFAAGIGEVLLAVLALLYSIELSDFFNNNQWIQAAFILIFFSIGVYFIYLKNKIPPLKKYRKPKISKSKCITGFSLALFNPPVALYWILAISWINSYIFDLTIHNSYTSLFLFFSGIYLGKITTLYFYGIWGNKMSRQDNSKSKLSKILGIALITISIVQGIKFLAE